MDEIRYLVIVDCEHETKDDGKHIIIEDATDVQVNEHRVLVVICRDEYHFFNQNMWLSVSSYEMYKKE